MEEVFLLGSNENESVLLKELSIPFSDLKLKEFLLTPSRVSSSSSSTTTTTTTTISLKDDLLLAEYHGIQVVFKRLCLISSSCCFTRKRLQEFKEKSKLLGCLRHPNIIQLIGITYDNFTNIGLIMEYLEKKDVYSLLRCRNHHIQLTWNDPLLQIAIDVAQGMSYLHHFDPPIVHRDLKTSNLLCTATFTCKISDFNEAKHERISLLNTIVGTPYWLAPEILREEKYDTKVDCYSFGIVLIELETRQDPFVEYKEINTIDFLIRVAKGELKPNIPMTCAKNRRLLIERCLDFDPKKRPQMTDILFSLQHEIREEIIGNVLLENDQRRVLLLQRHQMLNRYGVKDLLSSTY
jgi:serine/threonine protein kinase